MNHRSLSVQSRVRNQRFEEFWNGSEVNHLAGLHRRELVRRTVLEMRRVCRPGGYTVVFDAVVRIDTPGEADYFRNGGILQFVLRSLVA